MFDVTASIVLYRNPKGPLLNTINSFLTTRLPCKLVLIDNSPTDELRELGSTERCEYIFNNNNDGFGKAHNKAIESVINETRYHLILNPDVLFGPDVIEQLVDYMDRNAGVGLVMPRVLSFDSEVQHLARRLPRPSDLVVRRLGNGALSKLFSKQLRHYEMLDKDYTASFEAPSLSGCFMFVRPEALLKAGMFDERYFMYMEDVDLSRRVHRFYKTVYYPKVHIYHGHARGSYKWNKLLFIHIISAIRYFNKWGWLFDSERRKFNNEIAAPAKGRQPRVVQEVSDYGE